MSDSVGGWAMGATPKWEVTHLRRSAKGNSVPLPRAILRLVLAIVVPRILTRLLLTMLPPELGTYFLEADQAVYLSGAHLGHSLPLASCAAVDMCMHVLAAHLVMT